MSVFFAYRCPYCPGGLHRKRFEQDSILDWFAAHWGHLAEDPENAAVRARVLLGSEVYSFPQAFQEAIEEGVPAPATLEALESFMGRGYIPEEPLVSEHAVQVCTDDDEVGLSYYFFDGHFLKDHPELASFLAREDWRLPGGKGPGGFVAREPTVLLEAKGKGEGTLFLVELDRVGDMDELCEAHRLEGVRLPDLARFLAEAPLPRHPEERDPYYPLYTLRGLFAVEEAGSEPLEAAFLEEIRTRPGETAAWNAYSDWLQEQGKRPAGLHLLHRALTRSGVWLMEGLRDNPFEWDFLDDTFQEMLPTGTQRAPWQVNNLQEAYPRLQPIVQALDARRGESRSEVHVEDHVAQFNLHVHTRKLPRRERQVYHQWLLFDDIWASAHPDLANSILRFVRRWDVLSPEPREEG